MLKNHKLYYFSLFLILLSGLIAFISLSPDRISQGKVIILISVIYFIWGSIHHISSHSLSLKIMIEYFLIALLGITIAYFYFKVGLGI